MIYAWVCKECGYGFERSTREPTSPDPCPNCAADALRRDWRAESSNVWTFTNALGEGKVEKKVVGEGGAGDHMPPRGVGEA